MQGSLHEETEKLLRSWMQHDAAHLRNYLVAGVEDPRINLQSIFSRHFLLRALFGEDFVPLMEREYRFSAVMNWLQDVASRMQDREEFEVVQYALRKGSDNAEGLEIPAYVLRTFAGLPDFANGVQIPNYIEQFLDQMQPGGKGSLLDQSSLNTFRELWMEQLHRASSRADTSNRKTVIEIACGSANDFRFLQQYGLADFLDYTGMDLCPKNIENARALFPEIRFEIGNVLEIQAPNEAYEFGFVHDLFEHLSLEALTTGAAELCRVCRRGICIGFFNMDEIRDHQVRPVEEYHWNTLSMGRMKNLFAEFGFAADVVHVGSFLRHHLGCEFTHNPNAYTFFLKRHECGQGTKRFNSTAPT